MLGGFEVGLTSLFQAWFQVVMNFKIWSIWAFHGALRKATLAVPSDFESPKNCTWMSQELSKWSVNGLWSQYTTFTSIAARGGGGSFKRLKLYNSEEHVPIESFVTTLIHWTFFSDDANKVGICWLCRSGQLHVTPSSRWSLPRCHRSVRNDMRLFLRTKQYPIQLRTTKFWKVLPQYYSVLQSTTPEGTTPVLQSTTPVLLRTTKVLVQYTTPYYKVLLQYFKLLQSTTPVILRTTKYYSTTTPYYKVLLQYYSVLQSTTPVLLCTTKNYKVLVQYYSVLQSTTPVLLRTTKY